MGQTRHNKAGYSSTSMHSFSAMNFTALGDNTLSLGFSPIASNSPRYGLHQLIRTFTLTPAASANSYFDIAFILSLSSYIFIFLFLLLSSFLLTD